MSSLKAISLSVIIAFIWSTISWMVLPWHSWDIKSFGQNGQLVTEAIRQESIEAGLYIVPNMDMKNHGSAEAQAQWMNGAKSGPFAYMNIRPQGLSFSMGTDMLVQFLTQLIVSLIAYFLLVQTGPRGFLTSGLYVSLMVTSGAIMAHVPYWNWWGFPMLTTFVNIIDTAIGWFLCGMAMAKFVPSKKMVT